MPAELGEQSSLEVLSVTWARWSLRNEKLTKTNQTWRFHDNQIYYFLSGFQLRQFGTKVWIFGDPLRWHHQGMTQMDVAGESIGFRCMTADSVSYSPLPWRHAGSCTYLKRMQPYLQIQEGNKLQACPNLHEWVYATQIPIIKIYLIS
jgi:hypothetical protein